MVFDVKTGNGAFLPELESARALARSLVETSRGLGTAVSALITDMSQPLGRTCGNTSEVKDRGPRRHRRPRQRPIVENDLDLHRRIPPRVEDLPRPDLLDDRHNCSRPVLSSKGLRGSLGRVASLTPYAGRNGG